MNKMTVRKLATILLCITLGLSFYACNNKSSTTEGAKNVKKENVIVTFNAISDSLNNSWQKMMTSDDEKLSNMKRLAQEISYAKGYNLFLYDTVVALQSNLLAKRYDQRTMQVSDKITIYDNATDEVIQKIYKLAKTTPNIDQYQTAMQLVQEISDADNEVVIYRVRYDAWVRIYNEFYKKHKKEILKNFSSQPPAEQYYLFTLNE